MADACVQTMGPGVIEVTFTGAGADYDSQTSFPPGVRLAGIEFRGTAGDIIKVRNKSAIGTFIVQSLSHGDAVSFDRLDCFPYIDLTDCTFADITNARISFFIL